jgi:hypothetical protein
LSGTVPLNSFLLRTSPGIEAWAGPTTPAAVSWSKFLQLWRILYGIFVEAVMPCAVVLNYFLYSLFKELVVFFAQIDYWGD